MSVHESEIQGEVRILLQRAGEPRRRLLELIHTIDARAESLSKAGQRDHADVRFIERIIAQAVVAIAPALTAKASHAADRFAATRRAAEAYLAAPGDSTWQALVAHSTDSYPFGPGDGCQALDELGGHGTLGSGDFSGIGFLASSAAMLGDHEIMVLLRAGIQLPG